MPDVAIELAHAPTPTPETQRQRGRLLRGRRGSSGGDVPLRSSSTQMAGVNEPLWASYYIVSGGIIISNFTPFLHFAEGEEEENENEKGRAEGSKPFPGDGWLRSPREAKDAPRPQPQTIGLPSAAHPELACHSPVGLAERIKARPTCAPGPLCRSESGSPAPPPGSEAHAHGPKGIRGRKCEV